MNTCRTYMLLCFLVLSLLSMGACKGSAVKRAEKRETQPNKRPAELSWEEGQPALIVDAATQTRLGLATLSLTPSFMRPQMTTPAVVLSPQDLPSSRSGYIAALAQLQKSRVEAEVAGREYARLKILFEENQNISEKSLQTAEGTSKARDADVHAAEQQLSLQESTVRQEWGGVVANWIVEDAQELQHVLDQHAVLVQMTLPADLSLGAPKSISLEVPGGTRMQADLVSPLPKVDPRIQGRSFLYLGPAHSGLAPGVNLLAHLSTGSPVSGVIVPSSAVVWSEGKAWVYQQTASDRFLRRVVATDTQLEKGFFIASGLTHGDKVVTQGAQALLSEEALLRGGGPSDVD